MPVETVDSHIGDEGLIRNWLFYLGAGDTLRDFSGRGNHGDINGPRWTDGSASWGLSYDGSDDYVDIPNLPNFSEYTVMVMHEADTPNDGTGRRSIGVEKNNNFSIEQPGDGTLKIQKQNSAANWTSITHSLPADTFLVSTIRWDGTNLSAFKDDTKVDTVTSEGQTIPNSPDFLGTYRNESMYWNGDQSLILVYDVSKSDSFIKHAAREMLKLVG